ncbi:MAG: ADP-ribose pyrophosphatase [Arachnia propionica]|nr:MAG: ADP-ribose pyrophosphatase [Arachnia propionica]
MVGDRPASWPVQDSQALGAGWVTSFVRDEVRTPDGSTIKREYLTHPGAVAVVAWDEAADTIACLRQYRHPVRMELLEIPAGLLDIADEQWATAARRELAEEAQLAAGRLDVLVDICTSPGSSEESLRIYLARELTATPRPAGFELVDEEAHMSVEQVGREELVAAVFAGACQSPTLVAGVLALETARLSGRLAGLRPIDAPWPIRDQR